MPDPSAKKTTIRSQWPTIWNMVQDFVKEWKALGWYKANNPGKNATNLKKNR